MLKSLTINWKTTLAALPLLFTAVYQVILLFQGQSDADTAWKAILAAFAAFGLISAADAKTVKLIAVGLVVLGLSSVASAQQTVCTSSGCYVAAPQGYRYTTPTIGQLDYPLPQVIVSTPVYRTYQQPITLAPVPTYRVMRRYVVPSYGWPVYAAPSCSSGNCPR
jgi:hypothetical protein